MVSPTTTSSAASSTPSPVRGFTFNQKVGVFAGLTAAMIVLTVALAVWYCRCAARKLSTAPFMYGEEEGSAEGPRRGRHRPQATSHEVQSNSNAEEVQQKPALLDQPGEKVGLGEVVQDGKVELKR